MGRLRDHSIIVVAALAVGVIVANGQSPDERHVILNVGLPAIDEGLLEDETHTPQTPEARRRAALGAMLHADREGRLGSRYAPGRVIVKFRDEATPAARLAALKDVSATASLDAHPSYADFDMVRIDPSQDAEAVADAFAKRADVEYAQPAYRVHTLFVPNDPLYATRQWNLPLINLERAWDLQPQAGSSIVVAVLDTGVAFQNATLIENISGFFDDFGVRYPALGRVTIPYSGATQLMAPGRFVAPHDFIWDNDMPLDFDGHGTHVTGTIGQLTNDNIGTAGVAFNVKIMPVKVIRSDWDGYFGAPNEGTDDTVARGIRYAADNGAKIINMSIGRPAPPATAPAIESAINYAVGKGVFIATAAGNYFEEGNPVSVIAEIASRVQGAVSVAAVDRAKGHAYYSSTGSWVEIAAPGGSERGFGRDGFVVQQTFDFNFVETFLLPVSAYSAPRFDVFGYIGYIGTSMATPHVAGVAAMMMQQGITNPAAIEAALEQFAVDLGSPGRDNTFGFGLVDARNSLRGLGLAK